MGNLYLSKAGVCALLHQGRPGWDRLSLYISTGLQQACRPNHVSGLDERGTLRAIHAKVRGNPISQDEILTTGGTPTTLPCGDFPTSSDSLKNNMSHADPSAVLDKYFFRMSLF